MITFKMIKLLEILVVPYIDAKQTMYCLWHIQQWNKDLNNDRGLLQNSLSKIEIKTSIQWTLGSQITLSSKKIIFNQKWFLNKKIKKCINHACLIILATNTIFSDLKRIPLPKLHVKSQPHSLKIFWAKAEKVQKGINYA